ncbi:MAG: tetratricopeptide repeat protein [Planctomycetota bacterium]
MSLASLNPFKKSDPTQTETSIASSTSQAASNAADATRNAFSKTGERIAGMFGGDKDTQIAADDPLSLQNKPEKVGPEVFVANGQLWELTGNSTKAMEDYAKALEAQPNHVGAMTSIARLHFREGNYPKAAEFFQQTLAQTPNDAAVYNDLGLTLGKLGQTDMAVKTLDRALQLAPGTSRYANNLASLQFESGKADAAYEVLAANNKPAVAHFNMAYLHFKKGQSDDAQSHLQKAITFETQSAADPATKRAVERSKEMLAQLSTPGNLPDTPTGPVAPTTPSSPETQALPGAAAGPSAIVAGLPAHMVKPGQQVIGQVSTQASPGATVSQAAGVSGKPSGDIRYQDPGSYMSPQIPAGAPTSQVAPNTPSVSTPTATPPAVAPKMSAPSVNFELPPGFGAP